MKVFKTGMKYFKPYLTVGTACLLLGMLAQTLGLFLPKLVGLIVDFGLDYKGEPLQGFNPFAFMLDGRFGDGGSLELLVSLSVAFVVLLFVKHLVVYARNNILQWQGMLFNKQLRFAAMRKMFQRNATLSPGSTYTHLNNDTVNIKELFVSLIPSVVDNFTIVAIGFVLVAAINPYLIFVPLVALPIIVTVVVFYMKEAKSITKRTRQSIIDINYITNENLSNINLVKQFGREDYENSVFRGYNRRLKEVYTGQNRVLTKYGLIFNCIRAAAYVAAVALGSLLVIRNVITIGNFVEIVTYIYLILDGINNFMTQLFTIMQQLASGNRYVEFMDTPDAFESAALPAEVDSKPAIEICGLTVKDGNAILIKDITASIPYGYKLGVTGDIASGKSVLLKTINHFFQPAEGKVTFDGVSITDIPLIQLRNITSHLFEEVYITDGTIGDNVKFGNPAADDELVAKCMDACFLSADLKTNRLTLDTPVAGLDLSVQTKQLIAIARALVYDKSVYLLDQPLANVDNRLRKRLVTSLLKHLEERTVVVATLSSDILRKCDEILYLEKGQVVERGGHRSLMSSKGKYYQHNKKLAAFEEMQREQQKIREEVQKQKIKDYIETLQKDENPVAEKQIQAIKPNEKTEGGDGGQKT